jgi:hypothetical protein
MSGLTLGLMSLDVVEMEVLQRSGSPQEQKQAGMLFSPLHDLYFYDKNTLLSALCISKDTACIVDEIHPQS